MNNLQWFITCFFASIFAYTHAYNEANKNINVEWETLLAGFLAILGAYITVSQMRKQHKNELQKQDEQYEQEKNKARAMARFAASDAAEWLISVMQYIYDSDTKNNVAAEYRASFPSKPHDIFKEIGKTTIFFKGNDQKEVNKIFRDAQTALASLKQGDKRWASKRACQSYASLYYIYKLADGKDEQLYDYLAPEGKTNAERQQTGLNQMFLGKQNEDKYYNFFKELWGD